MCVIAAVIGGRRLSTVPTMLQAMGHNGQNQASSTCYMDQRAALGRKRLSAIDTNYDIHPDMVDAVSSACVLDGTICNGKAVREGYGDNLDYGSQNDGELVAALWNFEGSAFVSSLAGEFAFVVYNASRDEFYAARDRFGLRPLYSAHVAGAWYFASELKALAQIMEPEEQGAIREVPPGSYVTKSGYMSWFSDSIVRAPSASEPDTLRTRVEATIGAHLQATMGLRLGIFISGDLGSAIMAAVVAASRDTVVAFAAGMEGSIDLAIARQIAQLFDIELVECILTVDTAIDELEQAVNITESFNSAVVMEGLLALRLANAAQSRGIETILSAEGADELFRAFGDSATYDVSTRRRMRLGCLARAGSINAKVVRSTASFHSIEARLPFLDSMLVDWALGVPQDSLCTALTQHGIDKWILRKAFEPYLPSTLVWRIRPEMDRLGGVQRILERLNLFVDDDSLRRLRERTGAFFQVDKPCVYLYMLWRKSFGNSGGQSCFATSGSCGPTQIGYVPATS